jgi:hypothetical protein
LRRKIIPFRLDDTLELTKTEESITDDQLFL